MVSRAKNRLLWRTPLRLEQGHEAPSVDVLLPCCGEDPTVILDTVKACILSDYPPNRLRIFVLDDGKSTEVERLVQETRVWASEHSPVEIVYAARQKKEQWLKAANLNFGLDLVKRTDDRGAAEFVAVLDIDMIPERAWLRALVPHMLQDDQLGLVSSPQRFYNVPKGSSVISHIDEYMDLFAIIQDGLQSAYCTGSGFLVRRKALDSIGGFPTESIQDDILTSLHLRAKNWKVTFVQEDQQYGLRPATYGSFTKQWVRWMAGALDMVVVLRSPQLQSLPPEQARTGSALVFIRVFATFTTVFSIIGLLLTLLISKNHSLLFSDTPNEIRTALSLACLARTTSFLYDYYISRSTGFRVGWVPCSDIWLHPYRIQGLLVTYLRRLGVQARFAAAGTQSGETNPQGQPLIKRLKIVLWDYYAIIHLLYLTALLTGLVFALPESFKQWHLTPLSTIITAISWPGGPESMTCCLLYPPFLQLLYICGTQSFVPIGYALKPDEAVDRETLLVRDKDGVAHPTDEGKDLERKASLLGRWKLFPVVLAWYVLAAILSWIR